MAQLTYSQLIDRHLAILKGLQTKSGLFLASKPGTWYAKSWLRDNFYETLAFEIIGDWPTVETTYKAILKLFLRYEEKIDWAIRQKPQYPHQYIHARFDPDNFNEFWESWGNKQNDAVGCILFRIGELETRSHRCILKTPDHFRIVNKLVRYLESIQYWQDPDSGIWEEYEEVHASSIGACIAGLKSIATVPQIEVPLHLIHRGTLALKHLLPRESQSRFVDLALLSLIWPYAVVTDDQRDQILTNVEYHLKRNKGVIRYKGDHYFNANPDGWSEEAEWTFGLAWLAIIYEKLGDMTKAASLLSDLIADDTPEGLPELYFSNSPKFNEHTPLGWSESLFIVALSQMHRQDQR